jgi:hypothetical protein
MPLRPPLRRRRKLPLLLLPLNRPRRLLLPQLRQPLLQPLELPLLLKLTVPRHRPDPSRPLLKLRSQLMSRWRNLPTSVRTRQRFTAALLRPLLTPLASTFDSRPWTF